MTAQEIFKEKDFMDFADIMKVFDCGRDKARSIIRTIKSVSDISHISGKVTQKDYVLWSGITPAKDNTKELKRALEVQQEIISKQLQALI